MLRWLGMAGFLINTRGTTTMIDPLGGFDMPVLIDFPIAAATVPRLDAVLVTHSDNDHYSVRTCRQLAPVTAQFHSTRYVDTLMAAVGFASIGHDVGDSFDVGLVAATVPPADHAWQNESPASDRILQPEACCGFWLDTPDGTIWAPGDSWLITDHHLCMPTRMRCSSTSPTASGISASTGRSRWRTPTRPPRCCCTTGAVSMHRTSRLSTPTQLHRQTG